MEIFIDGDACPVVKQAEIIAKKYNLKVTLLCDTNHILTSNYSEIFIVCRNGCSRFCSCK